MSLFSSNNKYISSLGKDPLFPGVLGVFPYQPPTPLRFNDLLAMSKVKEGYDKGEEEYKTKNIHKISRYLLESSRYKVLSTVLFLLSSIALAIFFCLYKEDIYSFLHIDVLERSAPFLCAAFESIAIALVPFILFSLFFYVIPYPLFLFGKYSASAMFQNSTSCKVNKIKVVDHNKLQGDIKSVHLYAINLVERLLEEGSYTIQRYQKSALSTAYDNYMSYLLPLISSGITPASSTYKESVDDLYTNLENMEKELKILLYPHMGVSDLSSTCTIS